MAVSDIESLGVRSVMAGAFRLLRRHFVAVSMLALALTAVSQVGALLIAVGLGAAVRSTLARTADAGAFTVLLCWIALHLSDTVLQGLVTARAGRGRARLGVLAGVGAIWALCILTVSGLLFVAPPPVGPDGAEIYLVLVVLIAPAAIAQIPFAVVAPAAAVGDVGVLGSYRLSARLTRGSWGGVIVLNLIQFFVMTGLTLLLLFAIGLAVGGDRARADKDGVYYAALLAVLALFVLRAMVAAAMAASLYLELMRLRGDEAPETRASIFD
jgi:hypothetical protein